MIVEIRVSISEKGRTNSYINGKAIYENGKIEKVYINSSSMGQTEEAKNKTREIVGEMAITAINKMT